MDKNNQQLSNQAFNQRIIDISVKLAAIALILSWCFQIISPFILVVVWGAILAVALFPIHTKLTRLCKGKKSAASAVIAIVGILLITLPSIQIGTSAVESAQHVYTELEKGTLEIPAPSETIKSWPLIGEKSYDFWLAASENLADVASQHADEIKTISGRILSAVGGIAGAVLMFIVSLIISAVFMTKSTACYQGISAVMNRLMGSEGDGAINTTILTIRSVATGVLGVAVIQAFLAGAGLLIADIPGAGLWAIAVLVLAIAQLPPIIILGPIAAYYFSVADSTSAFIFLIYSMVVSTSDAFLKPIFLGRGMKIPMLVILLGAIGGMLLSGIIGLFVGAVTLALGYELFTDWLSVNNKETDSEEG